MKQTKIGLIPDDWNYVLLKDVAKFQQGYQIYFANQTKYKLPGFDRYLYITDFYSDSNILFVKDSINYYHISKKDICIANTGASAGKAFRNKTGILSNNMFKIFLSDKLDEDYAWCFFNSPLYGKELNEHLNSAGQPHVGHKNMGNMQIPLPPTVAEQQRIAKALSDVDTLISTTEKLIQKKKNIKQGTMQNLLTGKKRLPGFGPQTKSPDYKQTELGPIPEDWEVKSLNLLGTILRGVSYKPEDASEKKISNYIPLLRSNNVFDSRINFSNLVYIKPHCVHQIQYMSYGDILICAANGSASLVGKNAYYNKTNTVTFGAFMSVFRCFENQNHSFIRYLFQTDLYKSYLKEILAGSAINNLTPKNLLNLSFSLPSSLQEQTAIANVLSSMDKEIETLNTKLEKYRNLKTAMMQQLLTGKIRLVK